MADIKLGITKIGELLIDKKIKLTYPPNKEIPNVKLEVPEYQRPYKWTVKNALRLFDDIVEAMADSKERYRVGTLILHEEDKRYNIVDGQQRLITFSLLLKCFSETPDLDFLKWKLEDNSYNKHNVPSNYQALERRLMELDSGVCSDLYEYIKGNCELVVIITESESEAFQFFDSQNARGKALYPHDLLKAYHLREMRELDESVIRRTVESWEELDQDYLAGLFDNYLYVLKEWIKGNKAKYLCSANIGMFKGVSSRDNLPYAQYHKSAFACLNNITHSYIPFVTGNVPPGLFQIDAPVIAGKPFFDYAEHYYKLLKDIQNNDKHKDYFINGNEIVKTLNWKDNREGAGNKFARRLFDIAILFYVDRFCHMIPSDSEINDLNRFVVLDFIWAYSMRAQYSTLQWDWAQNYVLGNHEKLNSFNIYRLISDAATPAELLSELANRLVPLKTEGLRNDILKKIEKENNKLNEIISKKTRQNEEYFPKHYLSWFMNKRYLDEQKDSNKSQNREESK